jgi:hypothetical protein
MATDPMDSSTNIILVIISKRIRWTQTVAHMVDKRNVYRSLEGTRMKVTTWMT